MGANSLNQTTMLVRVKKPISGFAYFVGDSFELAEKKADELVKSGHVEKIEVQKEVIAPKIERSKIKTR